MDFTNLLKFSYYFNPSPVTSQQVLIIYLIFFLILVLLAVLTKIYLRKLGQTKPPYLKLLDITYTPLLTCAILGIVLTFFRWQELPYLSMRILIILLMFFILGLSIYVIIYYLSGFQKELRSFIEQEKFNQYIPKPKKLKGNKRD